MLSIATILPIAQLILSLSNIIILAYAFFKFLNKPQDTLNTRITLLETEVRDIKASLLQGNEKFKEQEETNKILIHSVLALIEFEIQYCLLEHKEMSDGLKRAKEDLNSYLSKR